jgi:hypothetical protein
MTPFITAGAAFLFGVLWFDLMFDVQLLAHRRAQIPDDVLASVSAYYARVTTAARPMNRLVAFAMVAMIASIVVGLARGEEPNWLGWVSLPLAILPVALAGARTVANAIRLGTRADLPLRQTELAMSIFADHVFCATCIVTLLALQLIFG